MRNYFLVAALALPLMGCNTLNRLIHKPNEPHGAAPVADDVTVTGTTATDYQIIQPIRCADSVVTVKVMRAGETTWRECNQYEVKLDTTGTGGGGVWFKKQVDLVGGSLGLTGKPVAPVGTKYEIRSIALSTGHNLY